jgi:hypothetical protein
MSYASPIRLAAVQAPAFEASLKGDVVFIEGAGSPIALRVTPTTLVAAPWVL